MTSPKREPESLYRKFVVTRVDGTSAPGGKHEGCSYFVLDLSHDEHAFAALSAYADACEADRPQLAVDLRQVVRDKRIVNGLYEAGWER